MKLICTFISLFFIIIGIMLVYFLNTYELVSIPVVNTSVYAATILIIGFCGGYILNQGNVEVVRSESTKQLRKAEKANIDTKESIDKIERLQAKIETLETALQEALKNKNA